jgi:hypothetical protein
MPSIQDYALFVERLEAGQFPRPFKTQLDAVRHLKDTLGLERWTTAHEQEQSRQLMERLKWLQRLLEDEGKNDKEDTVVT